MGSHLSAIGFMVDSKADFAELVKDLTRSGVRRQVTDDLRLTIWTDASGSRFVTQHRRSGGASTLPCIAGTTKAIPVRDIRLVDNETATLELFDPASGLLICPIAVDLEDSYILAELGGELDHGSLSLAALAERATLHHDRETYYASQEGADAQFAADFFIPSGTFPLDPDAKDWSPSAQAIFAGEVLHAELRTNSFSGNQFHLVTVRTIAEIELEVGVAKSDLSTLPQPGNVLKGQFFLTGSLGLDIPSI